MARERTSGLRPIVYCNFPGSARLPLRGPGSELVLAPPLGDPRTRERDVSTALLLVIIVVVAYLAAHVAFEWLAKRYLIVSGAEYLVLGLLIGPEGAGLLGSDAVESVSPLTTVALGWVGALVGTQFYLPALTRVAARIWQVAATEALLVLATAAVLLGIALHFSFDIGLAQSATAALALAAVAVATAPTGIEVVARRLGDRGPVVRQLEMTAMVDASAAILTLGLLAAATHSNPPAGMRAPTPTEWAVIAVSVGLVGGALYHLFLGAERNVDRLFISLVGAVALTSGSAAYLGLSPLLVCLVMGATLVNTSSNRGAIVEALARAERPFYFVLLILAGASWVPSVREWGLVVVLFLVTRTAAKVGSARLSARLAGALGDLGPDWGRALLGQGGLALALALDYASRDNAPLRAIVFTAAIASVLLTDLASARFVHSVVAPIGERARRAVEGAA